MSVVINILAGIGIIFILSTLFYYTYKYIKERKIRTIIANKNPPDSYMQNTGLQCPDYWVNTGVDANGKYICSNSFNIPSNNSSPCNSTSVLFSPITEGKTWEYNNPNGLTSLSDNDKYNFLKDSGRCDWINNCGPKSGVQGIWTGVNEICNSPPPTQKSQTRYSK